MSKIYITYDDLDIEILKQFILLHRQSRSLEAMISMQTSLIVAMAAELDELRKHTGLARSERADRIFKLTKELCTGYVEHLTWTRGLSEGPIHW